MDDQKTEQSKLRVKHEDQYDPREPWFLGTWKKSSMSVEGGFSKDIYDEPHIKRKKAILSRHPEVINMYGYSILTKYIVFISVFLYVIGIYIASTYIKNWVLFFCFSYLYGGSFASLAGVIIHECSHLTAAKTVIGNIALGLFTNIMIIFPISGSFKKYHLDHHRFLGVKNKDPDLPMDIEIKIFSGGKFIKTMYIMVYPLFYISRSMFVKKNITFHEVVNLFTQSAALFIIYKIFGIKAIYFMTLSSWLGYSIHPAAAHLIQEHFTFEDGQETYSYYGPLNKLFMNIGYHNEHHDFAAIPWDRLPEVYKMAPEYYDCYRSFNSWLYVFYEFIFNDSYGPHSRVVRDFEVHNEARRLKVK